MTIDGLVEIAERMRLNVVVPLELEVFGDDVEPLVREYARITGTRYERLYKAPWVARITGSDARYRFARDFQEGNKSYEHANSVGSRGVTMTYWLNNGVYEICQKTSWQRSRRYFLRIMGGERSEIAESEVLECLKRDRLVSAC